MYFRLALMLLCLLAVLGVAPAPLHAAAQRPNIILILADDLGFSDLGCYGGEIRTPHLDALAAGGLRFTQMYNSARCCPSRASLMTGLYPHQAGVGMMTADQGLPGYRGHLVDTCVTIPERMKQAGYRTFMSGKWHLSEPGPIARGFDEFYGFTRDHSTNCFSQKDFVRLPAGRMARVYDPKKFYATDAITDYALEFMQIARREKQPYFLYVAYNAPHFPLQALPEDIARYADVYAAGWDAVRAQRFERMKKLGVIDPRWTLSPRSEYWTQRNAAHGVNPAWDSLDADRRTDLARRMAVYAAMVDRMDQNIGRIVADLAEHDETRRTIILFLSDNGACAEWDPFGFDVTSGPNNVLHRGEALAKMGDHDSYISFGSGWANACNTPLSLQKHYAHEGGICTPLIAHWPEGIARRGEIDHRPSHLMDIMTTCLELAGGTYPQRVGEREITASDGRSLVPAFRGEPAEPRTLYFEHEGNRGVREGKWKLVSVEQRGNRWELYDLDADRTETRDLAAAHPEIVARLAAQWDEWAHRTHVLPKPKPGPPGKKKGKK